MNYTGVMNILVARSISEHLEPHQCIGPESRGAKNRKYHDSTNIHFLTSLEGPMIFGYIFLKWMQDEI